VTDAKITTTPVTVSDHRQVTIPQVNVTAATSLGSISVAIPDSTTIVADSTWDGTISLPQVRANSSVSVPNNGNTTNNVQAVIEFGASNTVLTFSKAVRIVIPGMAGKSAGYVRGGIFHAITAICSQDSQDWADSNLADGSEAKIDVDTDLVIWTKHFTQFVAYTTIVNGSGGGASTPAGSKLTSAGGIVTANGITLTVPAGAQSSSIYVEIKKLTTTADLSVSEQQRIVSDVFEATKNITTNFSKAVTIKVNFDKSKADTDKYDLALSWYDTGDKKWVALDNCKVDLSQGTVSGEVSHFTKFAVIATRKAEVEVPVTTLNDIGVHWAKDYINTLVQSGALNGYPDNSFKPDNNITRAEFATVLVKACQLPVESGKIFSDTASHWAGDYISAAYAAGIVSGYSNGSFKPDDLITREQMAVMIAKAAKLKAATVANTFTDSSQASSWANDALNAVIEAGIMKGYPDETFNPQGKATRAETAAVIVNALKILKK
jgi:hypothetical protein